MTHSAYQRHEREPNCASDSDKANDDEQPVRGFLDASCPCVDWLQDLERTILKQPIAGQSKRDWHCEECEPSKRCSGVVRERYKKVEWHHDDT